MSETETKKTLFQIKSTFGDVLFERKTETLKECVEAAVAEKIDLRSANLRSANLGYANLRSANLGSANLRSANLGYANLGSANLGSANLRSANLGYANLGSADLGYANLRSANLGYANLRSANLGYADLGSANLGSANLRSANLGYADLRSADLEGCEIDNANLNHFRQDLIAEVLRMPDELDALRDTINAGKIDGSTYSGECSCLAGTLATARGIENYGGGEIACNGFKFTADSYSPREQWFSMIRPGHKPETHVASRLALEWVDEAIAIRDHIRATVKN